MDIRIALTDVEIKSCFPALRELRPHLSEQSFVAQIQRQMKKHGYALTYITLHDQVIAAAGYRISKCLAWGRILYVDDLISLRAYPNNG